MVWKLGDRVIYADRVHIGKDLRASIIDNTSLVLTGVDTQYTGDMFSSFLSIIVCFRSIFGTILTQPLFIFFTFWEILVDFPLLLLDHVS